MSWFKTLSRFSALGFFTNLWDALKGNNPLKEVTDDVKGTSGLSDLFNKTTGAALTGAEREANEFTHNERIQAQNWTAQREDTMYQRQVADMQAAGINPMMAASSGVHNASAAAGGSSVSPSSGSLSDLLQLILLPKQMKLMDAQAKDLNAGARKKQSDVDVNEVSIEEARKRIEKMSAEIGNINADTILKTSVDKLTQQQINVAIADEALKKAQEADIAFMRASRDSLAAAQTEKAKAEAVLAYYNGLYERQLIDNGMAEKVCAKIAAETIQALSSSAKLDEEKVRQEIENAVKTGKYTDVLTKYGNSDQVFYAKWFNGFVSAADRVTSILGNVLHL